MPKKMPTFEAVVDTVWSKHITKLGGQGDEFRTSVWRFLVDRYDLSENEAKILRKKVMDQLESKVQFFVSTLAAIRSRFFNTCWRVRWIKGFTGPLPIKGTEMTERPMNRYCQLCYRPFLPRQRKQMVEWNYEPGAYLQYEVHSTCITNLAKAARGRRK